MPRQKLVLFTDGEYKKICKNPPANFRFPGYYIIKGKRVVIMNPTKHKPTLNDILKSINEFKAEVREGFKQVNARIDYIVKSNNLKDLPKKNKK